MNIYFLVEGEAELRVYPAWIDTLLESKLSRNFAYHTVTNNQYYIFNGGGIGKMVHHSIRNAANEIIAHPVFDYFVIVADADDQSIMDRTNRIELVLNDPSFPVLPPNCTTKIIIQNRCFETWLCGHRSFYATALTTSNRNVRRFIDYYNVATNDPELMLKDPVYNSFTIAKYHFNYLHHLLIPNNSVRYNKGTADKLIDTNYLSALKQRLIDEPTHLSTFNEMLAFLEGINRVL
jgi:hypothetical protein